MNSRTRKVRSVSKSRPTVEGAGVHLKRAFGFNEVPLFDPFLMLDDFHSDRPEHYSKGFPWHPHRGIETVTYVLHGEVEHGDSMGNEGVIHSGDVQWMTAGSGVVHQEMPAGDPDGLLWGFQLWANLPAAHKMMAPRYRDVKRDRIPEVTMEGGVRIKIISGEVAGERGPVQDIVIEPEFLDITVPQGKTYFHSTRPGHTVFAYVIGGEAWFGRERDRFSQEGRGTRDSRIPRDSFVNRESLVLFDDGEAVAVSTGNEPVRFLLFSGRPLREPVAWSGPIVMNTQEELRTAFEEFRNGNFIKHQDAP